LLEMFDGALEPPPGTPEQTPATYYLPLLDS
jgi:hypothetical protein